MIQGLQSLDRNLFLFLNSFHAEWLNGAMVFLSGEVIWIPFIIYILWSARKFMGSKGLAVFVIFLLLTLFASDVSSSYIVKNIFNRLRPCRTEELKQLIHFFGQRCGGKFGFVSSHAANSFTLVFFALRTLPAQKKWRWWVWILPLLVSYSRIYLGVHYPGDILGGILIGLWWGWFFSWSFNNTNFKVQV